MTETASGPSARDRKRTSRGLTIQRIHTRDGVHPYDEVTWERRDVVMTNWRDGSVNFEQRGVEFPDFWSVNAANIVTTKYFRGAVGTPQREWSLKQLVDRVVGVYVAAGREHGYFATPKDAEIFDHELKHALVHQVFSFNSPVWFNVGTSSKAQVSACFILAVDDTMDSILEWYKEEGLIFKGGSGAGVNLSRIRSSKELLSSGGTASGPVSFMRGADASAGTIKSGGATRRAAKMVVLDIDHPDVEDFITTKAREEEKVRVLRDAGFDMDLGGKDITSVQYQNANNSVRVSDEFMRAVEKDEKFDLLARQTGETIETVDAKGLFRKVAEAAWECADPGIQYDDTINEWHTCPEAGRITASNPCFPADQRVVTDRGLVAIGDLVRRAADEVSYAVYTNDLTSESDPQDRIVATEPTRYMVTGRNEIVELRFSDGSRLRCTPNHRVWTANRGWVHASDLTEQDKVVRSFHHAPRPMADPHIPAEALLAARFEKSRKPLDLPTKWDAEFAHYLGWLTGDGCIDVRDTTAVTVYGSEEDKEHVLPRHHTLLTRITGFESKPSVQANGTLQLRVTRRAFGQYLHTLGVAEGRARDKVVPYSVYEAPEDTLVAFLQGLFDADGCVVRREVNETRYVGLGSRSEELLIGVQELLASLGIASRIYTIRQDREAPFHYTRKDGTRVSYSSDGLFYDLRISAEAMRDFHRVIGFSLPAKQAKLASIVEGTHFRQTDRTARMVSRESKGFEVTYNLTEPRNHSYIVSGTVVANCSEYVHLDNSSCNLASINLLKFLRQDGGFDVGRFERIAELVITAMDISICFADFPTQKIAETTRAYRQLGIGYANLGALLMATGHAYDSEGGRAIAAAITSLMTGAAYRRSTELAAVVGPYDGYERNATAHKRVMRKHADASNKIKTLGGMDREIHAAAIAAWQQCLKSGEKNGYRNGQASLLAPTGTIGLMMDCDTTGIEPDLALVKFKKLVGGGSMQIINQTVPRALASLGYQAEQAEAITEYISEHGHVVDAPGLRQAHYEVFDCAMGERAISPMGHVRMIAAVQPHLSGAVSKTVNMPENATIEDVEQIYFEGWKLGLKALAIYRDNCKVGQPLSVAKKKPAAAQAAPALVTPPAPAQKAVPERRRLPKQRPATVTRFSVAGAEGYMTASAYPDNGIGEVFLKLGKQGSTLAGVMDAFSMAISISLQYGVPLEKWVEKFTNMRFEPAGVTDDPDIRIASSVMDYVFRRLALDHLPYETRAELGILSAAERAAQLAGENPAEIADEVDTAEMAQSAPRELPGSQSQGATQPATAQRDQSAERPGAPAAQPGPAGAHDAVGSHNSTELLESHQGRTADAPLCLTCGTKMRPAGSCYVCEGCGATSGCS
ncbi:MAG TPA: vitamin B12-dependent ribonucleotide reductase [Streptosporangiaceae bacterium]|nr:vitamin B12-dependent ribonucleotide reductase [Streptosporangiaceae bacterium]